MKPLVILACCSIALFSIHSAYAEKGQSKQDNDWKISVAAGGLYKPSYLGDDDYRLMVLPSISAKYKDRFFASFFEGIGYNLINNDNWRVGPLLKYDFGRDEDGDEKFAVTGDDTNDLMGLGDVDGTAEVGGFVEYSFNRFSTKLEIRKGSNGHEGVITEIETKYSGRSTAFSRPMFYSFGPEFTHGDDDYNSAFFDVNATQSTASGLPQFDADAGIVKYGLHANAVIPIDKKLSVIGLAGIDRLSGDAADSSLVQQRGSENQGMMGILISYKL